MKSFDMILKSFGMSNQMLISDLLSIEKQYNLEGQILVGNNTSNNVEERDLFQFDPAIREEASKMAIYYELFYSLEKTIRQLISDVLESRYGEQWWDYQDVIIPSIKQEVEKNMRKEIDAGITPRSSEPLDYTTFGQLGEIIKSNWDVFQGVFRSQRAVEKILFNLNTLRNNIAHCSPLAEDEVVRLQLSIKDWFRQIS
ncbi:hypothetical protein IJ21_40530 [Paenibacillus sp. 32O-W]|uniref:Swt1 family HEPN domain-containing protein n=1 Tax=Paenibacillus sp. 32O-W TaxID=1695218 RepID=UPI000721E941|nr:Swt1 family HEPN domain-containing protein [Paenibacillus sp. 32O-W]ALS29437.1 hypothetical protein IJ21_40530 [Paenibacillus sp. 32O-W]